jgi:hypothetical protein
MTLKKYSKVTWHAAKGINEETKDRLKDPNLATEVREITWNYVKLREIRGSL